jgi:hypothetical protein
MVKFIRVIVVATGLLCSGAVGQDTNRPNMKDNTWFATNQLIAKGGIGVISSGSLYIDLKSTKNELRLGAGNTWTGQAVPNAEVVTFFENKVWPEGLPANFDLSKAIIISFEGDKVRFFDFGKMSGGYYKRTGQN